jgi:hypothetical protein
MLAGLEEVTGDVLAVPGHLLRVPADAGLERAPEPRHALLAGEAGA